MKVMNKFSSVLILLTIISFGCKKVIDPIISPTPPIPPSILDSPLLLIGSGNNLFSLASGNIYIINALTGDIKWQASTYDVNNAVTFWSNTIFYTESIADNSFLVALDKTTKIVKWKFRASGVIESNPQVVNGIIFFSTENQHLEAVNATTGALVWNYYLNPALMQSFNGSPVVSDGVVYIGDTDRYLYAIDAVTGMLRWKYTDPDRGVMNGNPSVAGGVVYVAAGKKLFAINAINGTLKWDYTTSGYSILFSSPTVNNNSVYFGDSDSSLYSLDVNNGSLKWKYSSGLGAFRSPVVLDDVLYAATCFRLNGTNIRGFYAINASTGALKWMFSSDNPFYGSPVVFNDLVYIPDLKNIYAFSLDGILKWKRSILGSQVIGSSACIVDTLGNVFHAGDSGDHN